MARVAGGPDLIEAQSPEGGVIFHQFDAGLQTQTGFPLRPGAFRCVVQQQAGIPPAAFFGVYGEFTEVERVVLWGREEAGRLSNPPDLMLCDLGFDIRH